MNRRELFAVYATKGFTGHDHAGGPLWRSSSRWWTGPVRTGPGCGREPRQKWSAWVGWAAAALLGAGPFVAYVVSRSVGLPGDHGDVGDWGYWVGTVSLVIEAALIVLGITMLMAYRQRSGQRLVVGRLGQFR